MNKRTVKVGARMSSNSCGSESGSFSSASNVDFMEQKKSGNVNSSIAKPDPLKNAQVKNWTTQNSEYFYDKENICYNAPLDQCFTETSEYCDHSPHTPHGNNQDHVIVGMNDSLTKDCDRNKLATVQLLPGKYREIPSSVKNDICLKCTEGTLSNFPCKSKAHFVNLMFEITSDPAKSAQLEALPVTSFKSYRELIRQNPNISAMARKNMLQVLDNFRELDNRNRSASNVQHQQPDGDSKTFDTSLVQVCQPVIKCSESKTPSVVELIPKIDCTSRTDKNSQALKTHNSNSYYPRHMPTAQQNSDETNYMHKNEWILSSNSCVELKDPHMKPQPLLTSDPSSGFLYDQTQNAHQQLVYTCETFTQLAHFKYSSMNTRQYPRKPLLQELGGVTSKVESNVEHHPCDSPGKLQNKLTLHRSNNLEDVSIGETDIQGSYLSNVQVPPQNIEHGSEAHTPSHQCSLSSLHSIGDSEDFSSELDEEPLSQESLSSAEFLNSSSDPRALNSPMFPQRISERELVRKFTLTQYHNKSTNSFAHSEPVTHAKQSSNEHVNILSLENETIVLRYKRRKLLSNVDGAAACSRFNQRPAKIPSLVDMCLQVVSGANTLSTLVDLHLRCLAENTCCDMRKSSINSHVTQLDRSTQCQYTNFISNFKSNANIHMGSLPTNLHVDNYGTPDTIRRYLADMSSSLITSDEHSSGQTLKNTSYSSQEITEERSFDNNSKQSPELNGTNFGCQYILLDIQKSMAIVE